MDVPMNVLVTRITFVAACLFGITVLGARIASAQDSQVIVHAMDQREHDRLILAYIQADQEIRDALGDRGIHGFQLPHNWLELAEPMPDRSNDFEPSPAIWVLGRQAFDDCIFRELRDTDRAHAHVVELLSDRLNSTSKARRLTTAQRSRLVLAGRKDIDRLFERIEQLRRKFEQARDKPGRGVLVLAEESRLLTRFVHDGPFGAGSFYSKVLDTIIREAEETSRARGRESEPGNRVGNRR